MKIWFWTGLAAALGAVAGPAGAAPAPPVSQHWSLRWVTNATSPLPWAVEALALSPQAQAQLQAYSRAPQKADPSTLFRLFVEPAHAPLTLGLPPMAGSHAVQPPSIRFEPEFPLQKGVSYRAEFQADLLPGGLDPAGSPALVSHFLLPAPPQTPTTVVSQIYPSADRLPENLLKFYLHFSASMSRGYIYEHIRLLNAQGRPVDLPFLEIDQELWNPDLTRLTLLIDPGRIKRGVKPLEDIGPALEEGRAFTLVIGSGWKDAQGTPLQSEFRKSFRVTAPDRTPPDPEQWTIHSPAAGTRDSLAIEFGESMDHALALRLIRVQTPDGQPVPGQISLGDQEKTWRFLPESAWTAGAYALIADTILEDLAGNSIGRPFEVDVFDKVERTTQARIVSLPFTVTGR